MGNGLRPDIWETFQERFAIPRIREFYGATEGATPIVNFAGVPGRIGRQLPGQEILRCDVETGEVLRDAAGRCQRARAGEGIAAGNRRTTRIRCEDAACIRGPDRTS